MSIPGREFDTLVPPWDDQTLLEESDAIKRLDAVVTSATAAGCRDAARLAVIAIGNYAWQSQDWPELIARANAALDKLEDKLSRRWG
jgi:hypothetical protein